jgi:hypothetical protein
MGSDEQDGKSSDDRQASAADSGDIGAGVPTSRPSLNIQDYLDATSDAAGRTRAAAYAIVFASILMLSAVLNSLPGHWMRGRLMKLNDPDSDYVKSFIGPRPQVGSPDRTPGTRSRAECESCPRPWRTRP